MSLTQLLPYIKSLPRSDKFRLVQELIAELVQEEGVAASDYPVWSPYDAYEAAKLLLQRVEQDEQTAPVLQQLRPFGLCRGEFIVPPDFDAPLPEEALVEFEGV